MAGKYGGVAPHVEKAGDEIAQKFGVKSVGGRASSGHISGSDHYTGHALDFMVNTDKAKGDAILAYVNANWKRLGVKYVIWYRKYYSSPNSSKTYVGPSPHTDHVHVSFQDKPGEGGPAVGTGDMSGLQGCLGSILGAFGFNVSSRDNATQNISGAGTGNYGLGGTPAKNFAIAKKMAPEFGWGPAEVAAWYTLGMKESGWNNRAQNPTSTAYGIGQFLDSTWKSYGPKTSDPTLQIKYMAMYIKDRYGTPSKALAFHIAHNWY